MQERKLIHKQIEKSLKRDALINSIIEKSFMIFKESDDYKNLVRSQSLTGIDEKAIIFFHFRSSALKTLQDSNGVWRMKIWIGSKSYKKIVENFLRDYGIKTK